MRTINSKFEPQPNELIADIYDGELEHFAPNEQWTISYTAYGYRGPAFKFASHHSEFGDAAFRVTGEDALTPAERRVVALGALGLTACQTAEALDITTDTVKSQRRMANRRYLHHRDVPESFELTIQSLTHVMFTSRAFQVMQSLPTAPDRLTDPKARAILDRAVTGKTQQRIANDLNVSLDTVKLRLRHLYVGQPPIHGVSEAITLMHLQPTAKHPRI